MNRGAILSPCGKYRFLLTRVWDESRFQLPFVMLNPSTADARVDDPTIRRCMGFARREGFGGIAVVNLYPYRAANPKELAAALDRGEGMHLENEPTINDVAAQAARHGFPVVAAWGSNPLARGQFLIARLRSMGVQVKCLGTTSGGSPRHPLYVRGDQPLVGL